MSTTLTFAILAEHQPSDLDWTGATLLIPYLARARIIPGKDQTLDLDLEHASADSSDELIKAILPKLIKVAAMSCAPERYEAEVARLSKRFGVS